MEGKNVDTKERWMEGKNVIQKKGDDGRKERCERADDE